MGLVRRGFTREFKIAAIKELEAGKTVGVVARQMEVSRTVLYRWYREYKKHPTKAFSGPGKAIAVSHEAELERKVGQLTMEIDFLKKVLERLKEDQANNGGERYTRRSAKKVKR
jgi:Transposase and inactivated derivatives